jgi:hypothetical protein
VIDQWHDQGYGSTTYTTTLGNGNRNMVIEYYENGGDNRITFTLQLGNPLPIHLVSFSGKEKNKQADLNWLTSYDSNTDYFELEKSTDGSRYTSLASIASSTGRRATDGYTYHYTDATLSAGQTYYRLKMVDLNGIITYSPIALISSATIRNNEISLFPTLLTSDRVYLKTGRNLQQAVADIFDISGKWMGSRRLGMLAAGQTTSFTPFTGHVAPGLYLVKISDGAEAVAVQKILVSGL